MELDDDEKELCIAVESNGSDKSEVGSESGVDIDIYGSGSSGGESSPSELSSAIPMDAGAVSLDVDMDESGADIDIEEEVVDPGRWIPGMNTGDWLTHVLPPQALGFLGNVVSALGQLPKKIISTLAACYSSIGHQIYIYRIAAGLLGISVAVLKRHLRELQDNQWTLKSPSEAFPHGNARKKVTSPSGTLHQGNAQKKRRVSSGPIAPTHERIDVVRARVRLAIAHAVEGRPVRSFERDLQRMQAAGAYFGGWVSRHWAQDVEFLAVKVVQSMCGGSINTELPGLGIPSDFSMCLDPIPIGGMFSRYSELLAICIIIVDATTGRLGAKAIDLPMLRVGGHAAVALCDVTLKTLRQHPARLNSAALRARLGLIGGDGAIVKNGPKHPSVGAAEQMWNTLHPLANNFECTYWDVWHRFCKVIEKTMGNSSASQELLDVLTATERMLGLGEGKMLCSAVSNWMNVAPANVRGPGGTRAVYQASLPGRFLEQYKVIALSMHAKLGWKKAGHGSTTLESLRAISRRLSSCDFVLYATLMSDVLERVVIPYGMAVQSVSLEPWIVAGMETQMLATVRLMLSTLHWLDKITQVIFLCRQHLTVLDVRAYVFALRSSASARRCFPRFFANMVDLCFGGDPFRSIGPMFKGTHLNLPSVLEDRSQQMCLGPHCQCHTYGGRRLPRLQARREAVRLKWTSNGAQVDRDVLVPLWVSRSPHKFNKISAEQAYTPPRVHYRAKGLALPRGTDGANLFRNKIRAGHESGLDHPFSWTSCPAKRVFQTGQCPCMWSSSCQVSHAVPVVAEIVHVVIQQTHAWLQDMQSSLLEYLRPPGPGAEVGDLLQCMSQCWDWSFLLWNSPTAAHVRSFKTVVHKLLPFLKHTLWPQAPLYKDVEHVWDVDAACRQYVMLVRRVRTCMDKFPSISNAWVQADRFEVTPVCTFSSVEGFMLAAWECYGMLVQRGESRAWLSRTASLVSGFLGEGFASPGAGSAVRIGGSAPSTMTLRVEDLRLPGFRWQGRSKHNRIKWPRCRGRAGSIGTVGAGIFLGKFVIITKVHYRVDCSAVSASIDLHPYFCVGNAPHAMLTWHAARVHNRCRAFCSAEACCERLGSYMHMLFEANQKPTPTTIGGRVLLIDSGFQGTGRTQDEVIIAEVADIMALQGTGRRVRNAMANKQLWCGSVPQMSKPIREERRLHFRVTGKKSLQVPAEIDLQQFMSGNTVQALPMFRATKKGSAMVAGSSGRGCLKAWLDTEEGQEWVRLRDKMYRGKAGE